MDSFTVMDGTTELCRFDDITSGTEVWKTLTCNVNFAGVKTLTLHPLATGPWSSCDIYGQVAISGITFEAAPKSVDFKGGETCTAGWGVPAITGGAYGGKPYSEFCLVWEPTCAADTKSASIKLAFAGVAGEAITVNHLDGMSNLDSFDVLVDDALVGHYADSLNSSENWVITSFPVNVGAGIHTVTLKATDSAWSQCDSWGQIAVDYINVDECTQSIFYKDSDGDGYGNIEASTKACAAPTGYVANSNDCNDNNAAIHPGATESCDGIDNDCNIATIDGSSESWFNHATTCGWGVCSRTGAFTCQAGVKTDTCSAGAPIGTDNNCNGIDENCNGKADENYKPTATTCGIGSCAKTGQTSCVGGSIVDSCKAGTPTAEICDNKDNNCNGQVDEGLTKVTTCGVGICSGNTGYKTCTAGTWGGDTCNPLAGAKTEVCDDKDNNCNGKIDEPPGCTAAAYCGNINIANLGDIPGITKCITADWQNNERNRSSPNDCKLSLLSSGRTFKFVCVATPNAN
jgi:hypothetical protein